MGLFSVGKLENNSQSLNLRINQDSVALKSLGIKTLTPPREIFCDGSYSHLSRLGWLITAETEKSFSDIGRFSFPTPGKCFPLFKVIVQNRFNRWHKDRRSSFGNSSQGSANPCWHENIWDVFFPWGHLIFNKYLIQLLKSIKCA